MQGLQHAGLPQFSIPLGRFAALLAVVSVAAVGFPYLIGAVGQIVAFDGIIVNNAAIPRGHSRVYSHLRFCSYRRRARCVVCIQKFMRAAPYTFSASLGSHCQ
jgi:hypothetical protein